MTVQRSGGYIVELITEPRGPKRQILVSRYDGTVPDCDVLSPDLLAAWVVEGARSKAAALAAVLEYASGKARSMAVRPWVGAVDIGQLMKRG